MKHPRGTWRPAAPRPDRAAPPGWADAVLLVGIGLTLFLLLTLSWWDARHLWPELACC